MPIPFVHGKHLTGEVHFVANVATVSNRMDIHHVLVITIGLFQELVAYWTLELGIWLVIMACHVLFKTGCSLKALSAKFTNMDLRLVINLVRVHKPLMGSESMVTNEFCLAVLAFDLSLTSVSHFMNYHSILRTQDQSTY